MKRKSNPIGKRTISRYYIYCRLDLCCGECYLVVCSLCVFLSICLFVLCVLSLTVFVNYLLNAFAICVGEVNAF